MHLQIFLVLALTVSLAGISYIENVDAASGHNFESQWGKAGISKSGFFLSHFKIMGSLALIELTFQVAISKLVI